MTDQPLTTSAQTRPPESEGAPSETPAEARLHLLSQVLRLTQDPKRSVSGEADRDGLLRAVCTLLTEARGYRSVEVAPNVHVEDGPVDRAGYDPAAADDDTARLAFGLRYDGAEYGALIVALPALPASDPAEQSLLHDVAAHVGFALHHIEVSRRGDEAAGELRETEARVDHALDRCHIGAWEADLVDRTVRRSLEHDRIFGYDSLVPEWTLDTFVEHVVPEDRLAVERCINEAVAGRADWSIECRIRRRDGQVRWIWTSGGHVPDQTGQQRRIGGIVQDITERVKADTALRRSEQRLETIFDASPVGIRTTRVSNGELVDANETFLTIFGYEREEAIGRTSLALNLWRDPEYRARVIQALARDGSIANAEFGFNRRSGETGTALFSAGIIDVEGEPYMLALVDDITEQVHVREALRESEERFLLAFRATPVPQAITTVEKGVMLEVNEAFCTMMGYQRDELLGHATTELGLYADPAVRQTLAEIYRREGRLQDFELDLRDRTGKIRNMVVSCEPLEWEDTACTLSAFRDVTEDRIKERDVADALETRRPMGAKR